MTLPNFVKFEEGEVGQTGTPRTLVFLGRHILDIPIGKNTCDVDPQIWDKCEIDNPIILRIRYPMRWSGDPLPSCIVSCENVNMQISSQSKKKSKGLQNFGKNVYQYATLQDLDFPQT